jgi:hypothetical protein
VTRLNEEEEEAISGGKVEEREGRGRVNEGRE